MISLTGTLINIFKTEGGVNKDGESYDPQSKIQLLGDVANPNGSVKKDMYTLTVKDVSLFTEFLNEEIILPIGLFATGKNITYFVTKGGRPTLANSI